LEWLDFLDKAKESELGARSGPATLEAVTQLPKNATND